MFVVRLAEQEPRRSRSQLSLHMRSLSCLRVAELLMPSLLMTMSFPSKSAPWSTQAMSLQPPVWSFRGVEK